MNKLFDSLRDAILYTRETDLYVIDGPDDDYAAVDIFVACEIQACDQEHIVHYNFYSLDEAAAVDAAKFGHTKDECMTPGFHAGHLERKGT